MLFVQAAFGWLGPLVLCDVIRAVKEFMVSIRLVGVSLATIPEPFSVVIAESWLVKAFIVSGPAGWVSLV
jgi:hypothetical protein